METTRRRRRVLPPPPPRAPVVPDGVLALRVAAHEVHAARLPPADGLRLLVHEVFRWQAPRRHRPGGFLVRFLVVVDLADRRQRVLDLLAQRGRQRRFACARAFRVALLRALRGHGVQWSNSGLRREGGDCSSTCRGWPRAHRLAAAETPGASPGSGRVWGTLVLPCVRRASLGALNRSSHLRACIAPAIQR